MIRCAFCSSRARLPIYEHGNWNEVSESFVPAQAYPVLSEYGQDLISHR